LTSTKILDLSTKLFVIVIISSYIHSPHTQMLSTSPSAGNRVQTKNHSCQANIYFHIYLENL